MADLIQDAGNVVSFEASVFRHIDDNGSCCLDSKDIVIPAPLFLPLIPHIVRTTLLWVQRSST